MGKRKRKLLVFISYAKADRKKALELSQHLKNDGVDVWLDSEKIDPGLNWEDEIKKAVTECDAIVFCLTKTFNRLARGYRYQEVRLALAEADKQPDGEIFIIPAKLEKCELLDKIKKWQSVNLFERDGYDSLLNSLRKRAANIGGIHELRQRSLDSTVQDLMENNFLIFDPDDTIEDVRKLMKERGSTCAFIHPVDGNVWYIFTKTDLLIALSSGKDLNALLLKDFASEVDCIAHPNLSVAAAVNKMVKHGVSHLPVFDNKRKLIGLISGNQLVYL